MVVECFFVIYGQKQNTGLGMITIYCLYLSFFSFLFTLDTDSNGDDDLLWDHKSTTTLLK